MGALDITGHVIYNPAYTYKFRKNIFFYISFYFFSKIWNKFTPRRGTVSGLTNSSLVACYQDTCNILNSNSIKRTKPKYSINPVHETAKNLNNDVNDLWSLGYVRFEDEENSGYPQESREWKTVTTYSSKHKISTYIFISIISFLISWAEYFLELYLSLQFHKMVRQLLSIFQK